MNLFHLLSIRLLCPALLSLILGLLLLLGNSPLLLAEEPIKTKTTISHVTVYRQGAKIVCNATATIPSGNSVVVLQELSQYADPQSLQIALEGGGTLLSATMQDNFGQPLGIEKPDIARVLSDSIDIVEKQLNLYYGRRDVLNEEYGYLKNNMGRIGTQNEKNTILTSIEMQASIEYYRKHATEIKTQLIEINASVKDLETLKNSLYNRRGQLQAPQSDKKTKEVLLNIVANASVLLRIKCTYSIGGVSWQPIYDLRYTAPNKPLTLSYKAVIHQNTDFDWKYIQLAVATGNLLQNNARPILYPIYVDVQRNNYYATQQARDESYGKNMNSAYATEDSEKQAQSKKEEDAEPPKYVVTANENQLNAVFDIQLPQSIPSDNMEHIVLLTDYQINASYQYHTVPKINNGAYLLAQITDWGQYNLLPGQANLFLEDTYIGKSAIDPTISADTLLLSLGRDERISVKRVQMNEYTKTRFLGANKEQTFAYEIMVRNNKSAEIDLEILDQVPISRNGEIKVTIEEKSGANYVEEYGKILWHLNLKAGESKKVKLIYSVKSPKDMRLTGL